VFEKKMLRRIFGSRKGEGTEAGGHRIMKSFTICSPPKIVTIIKLKKMRWAGHVA
jgi:hypothetical protein